VDEAAETLAEPELAEMEQRCAVASKPPWESFVEGRDHRAGDNFIRVGGQDDSEPDLYVSRATGRKLIPASDSDLDFIAHARRDLPRLLAEVRRLQAGNQMRGTRTSAQFMHSRHEPPENELPSVIATPHLVWRGHGIVLAIPALMICTAGAYLLIQYRTAHKQDRTIEHARAAADRLRDLRADGRPRDYAGWRPELKTSRSNRAAATGSRATSAEHSAQPGPAR
jgi:hypothetical protein